SNDASLSRLRSILDKYLECPTLLDPYLEGMVQRLRNDDGSTTAKLQTLMHLLSGIYALSKVRGRKYIQRLLPHEAADVEPVLAMLQAMGEEAKVWESVYSLLTWLGIISLVPFDLHIIDSSLEETNDAKATTATLVQSILNTSTSHLDDPGPTRETAAACLASLLSRPDLEQSELEGFVNWSAQYTPTILPMPDKAPSVILVMGVLQTLAAIFKTGHRSNLLSTQQKQSILVAEGGSGNGGGGAMLLRKLLVKLFARIGCAYLPPRVAAWRYQRGKRSLVENLMRGDASTAVVTESVKSVEVEEGRDDGVLFQIPDQVEDAMDQLLRSLTDPATIVRWSAAKGIGRLTERLPAMCADDVLDAVLQTCSDHEHDRAWHGACLALAELARRGLLLPDRLGEVVPIVVQSIRYDVRRGQHSVGAHVRDAACYTCWAFARAYAPAVLRPHVKELSVALVLSSLFDREVNCRRAASAAFQESVGRQGADNFKHGIAILTSADYYSIGNRTESFLTISLDIAKFKEYREPIIQHLSRVKVVHWDAEIRTLASRALSRVSVLDPSYCATKVMPTLIQQCFSDDLIVRHGSLLGVAEMVLAFGELNLVQGDATMSDDLKLSIAELVPSIEKARLYRGRGGEIMRAAACRTIECISTANITLTVKQQVRLLDSVDACLVHPNETIQNSAAKALLALLTSYFPVSSKGPSERLQSRVVDKYISIVKSEDNPAATRGFSLALGHLPGKLLAPSEQVLDSVLDCLIHASKKSTLVGGEGDAETRRNAILSLINVCKTAGIGHSSLEANLSPTNSLTTCQTERVFAALLSAMEDYNMDRRGDVGSWSRVAAMNGLEALTYLSYSAKFFDEGLCCSILSALLKQLGEKLDAVRCEAGECLERLLTNNNPRLPFVPHRTMLIRALDLNKQGKNWSNPAMTFPLLMCAINIDVFLDPILSGLVISVGGLTESVSKSSSASLFEWIRDLRSAKATSKLYQMGEVFLGLFDKNKRNGRVLLPLLATLDKLLSHGYMDELLSRKDGAFLSCLMICLSNESKGCSDVKRLLAIVGVSFNVIQPHLETMKEMALPFIMTMLLNSYPRVRRYVAEQLFAKLSVDGDALFDDHECLEEANQLLLSVVWHDEHDPCGTITEARNRIADLL
ncbi:tubulin-specific chaperone d, partial [Thalassiosira pseudonana CCMP1335]